MSTENNKSETTQRTIEQRFEFVLKINEKIVVQRFFDIRNYNEDSVKSLEMKELMDNLVGVNNGQWGELGLIPKHLKAKSVDYLWENYKPYHDQSEDAVRVSTDKIDNYQFEIKVDKNIVAKAQFSGNFFPPKVRYAVDIKAIIPSIFNEIRSYMSQEKYTILESNLAL